MAKTDKKSGQRWKRWQGDWKERTRGKKKGGAPNLQSGGIQSMRYAGWLWKKRTSKAKLFQKKHPLDVMRQPRILVFLASVEVFFSSGQCPLAATLQKYSCQFGKTQPKSKSARSLAAKTRLRREIW